MKVTILGLMRGTTKSGKQFTTIHAQKDFTPYEMQNNDCVGTASFSEFTYQNVDLKPGDVCEFVYEPGYQGRATLSQIIVEKK